MTDLAVTTVPQTAFCSECGALKRFALLGALVCESSSVEPPAVVVRVRLDCSHYKEIVRRAS